MANRTVIYISDRTGITAEKMGHSLISQFEGIDFSHLTLPFIDTEEKALHVVEQINTFFRQDGASPIVFGTIIDSKIRQIIRQSHGFYMDFVHTFIGPLEAELQLDSDHSVGRSHGMHDSKDYNTRIDAVNFALRCDDGVSPNHYEMADIILIGVSRSGKTPTSLYLAMQFGIKSANFPIVPEDLTASLVLPQSLQDHLPKLFGLTISSQRLQMIRQARMPGSDYAAFRQCQNELKAIESLYQKYNIPYVESTSHSIEELSTMILAESGLERRLR